MRGSETQVRGGERDTGRQGNQADDDKPDKDLKKKKPKSSAVKNFGNRWNQTADPGSRLCSHAGYKWACAGAPVVDCCLLCLDLMQQTDSGVIKSNPVVLLAETLVFFRESGQQTFSHCCHRSLTGSAHCFTLTAKYGLDFTVEPH